MKIYNVMAIMLMLLSCVSCIQSEPLNSECDITEVNLPGDVLNRVPIIENNKVTIIVKNDVSVMSLAPEFTLTPGATIEPASGTERNFLLPQAYTVTAEDGEWHKTYIVEVQKNNASNLNYNFETVRQISALGGMCSYDEFYETSVLGKESLVWASANSSFALTLQASTPSTFPTYQGDDGVTGKCAVLVTRSTGNFGGKVGKPLASGNLFIGVFDGTNALKNPLQATHFGTPFTNEPVLFSGYYKYSPGETYCEPGENGELVPVAGKTDMFNLYAVLFETTREMQWLDGTNVLAANNPNIISTAEIPDPHASEEWVEFAVPFKMRAGKSIDRKKLEEGKYSITVVMGSSRDGDAFCGAIGSTLQVDELSITCASGDED